MTPRPLIAPRSAMRLCALLVIGLVTLNLGGCAFFRRQALALPAGFETRADLAGLRNPQTRMEAYKALFPELQTVWAGGGLVARKRLRPGKEIVDFVYFARNDADQPEHQLRLRGNRGPVSVFDLIVRGRYATVQLYQDKLLFQGPIPAEGSPFADRFGVEPWDLASIFTIGQHIARGKFESESRGRMTELTARDGAEKGGLLSVTLDNRSGLPTQAIWDMDGKTYEVRYLGWDFYTDPLNEANTRLMPTAVEIRREGLVINLKIRAYHYDQEFTDRTFDMVIDQNTRVLPLEKLKNIL